MYKLLVISTLLVGLLTLFGSLAPAGWFARRPRRPNTARDLSASRPDLVRRTDMEWKQLLTPEQYQVLRRGGTERPFTGLYWDHHADGQYHCGACGQALFDAAAKFDSDSGWPSYLRPVTADAVAEMKDISYGTIRTEVVCSRCESHLGHVFRDGPRPTGRRYCINSAALDFRARHGVEERRADVQ